MDSDRIAGKAKDTLGKAEAAFGDAVGDDQSSISGRARQAAGTAQDMYGQAKDAIGDQLGDAGESAGRALNSLEREVRERPLIALLIAALIGFVLAQLTTR